MSGHDEKLWKRFHDPIHGTITLHPFLVKIINTPQFQRLRNIKQLGSVYFVYPGASHNRFEHSIGTAHLAGKLVRLLKEKQPELDIDDEDIICVEIAGLCRDLGCAPYSHVFENMFMEEWKREEWSYTMFEHLIQENELKGDLIKISQKNTYENNLKFIHELINPKEFSEGRGEEKRFLYEIVSNTHNKVDVNKWDYIARDGYYLGIQTNFNHERFMQTMRVIDGQICARDNEADNLYELFLTRASLHRKAYKHRVAVSIDLMICDVMKLANKVPAFKFCEVDDEKKTKSLNDPVAFTKLNDGIFENILYSKDPELEAAQVILMNIKKRKLYRYMDTIKTVLSAAKFSELIMLENQDEEFKETDFAVSALEFDFGMKSDNSINKYRFYTKKNLKESHQVFKEDISALLPSMFYEHKLIIFCLTEDGSAIEKAIGSVCSANFLKTKFHL